MDEDSFLKGLCWGAAIAPFAYWFLVRPVFQIPPAYASRRSTFQAVRGTRGWGLMLLLYFASSAIAGLAFFGLLLFFQRLWTTPQCLAAGFCVAAEPWFLLLGSLMAGMFGLCVPLFSFSARKIVGKRAYEAMDILVSPIALVLVLLPAAGVCLFLVLASRTYSTVNEDGVEHRALFGLRQKHYAWSEIGRAFTVTDTELSRKRLTNLRFSFGNGVTVEFGPGFERYFRNGMETEPEPFLKELAQNLAAHRPDLKLESPRTEPNDFSGGLFTGFFIAAISLYGLTKLARRRLIGILPKRWEQAAAELGFDFAPGSSFPRIHGRIGGRSFNATILLDITYGDEGATHTHFLDLEVPAPEAVPYRVEFLHKGFLDGGGDPTGDGSFDKRVITLWQHPGEDVVNTFLTSTRKQAILDLTRMGGAIQDRKIKYRSWHIPVSARSFHRLLERLEQVIHGLE